MAIVAAAVIGFIHSGGSGDYGGLLLSALWLRSGYTNKQRKGTSPTTPFFLLGLLLSPPVTISPALLGIFGSSLKHWINVGAGVIDDDLRCCLSDEEFENLSSLKTLKRLSLAFNRITDACLVHLKGLVNLDSCKIGDEGLANLTGLTLLRSLVLSDTEIGSSGLRHISGCY
ncbi:F-box/LRR-repeat protein [Arachis hypogaea]|nr:F-box/LRR-repeat protein [Arachis hypogaea]